MGQAWNACWIVSKTVPDRLIPWLTVMREAQERLSPLRWERRAGEWWLEGWSRETIGTGEAIH